MSGTRGGRGRIAALAITSAVLVALLFVDAARGGTYEVAQCGWGVGAQLDPATPPSEGSGFSLADPCASAPAPGGGVRLVTRAPYEDMRGLARARWTAPSGTSIVAVRGVWSNYLQASLRQQLGTLGANGFVPFAEVRGAQSPTPVAAIFSTPAAAIEFRLVCAAESLETCWAHEGAWSSLREVILTLADPTPPTAQIGGSLLGPGWHRGTLALDASAEDSGAGVVGQEVRLDGAVIATSSSTCATATVGGGTRATTSRPCPPAVTRTLELDTARIPDGTHLLRACATDFAGNLGCAADASVAIDNSLPAAQFTTAVTGQVAASVADPASGPSSGAIAIRRVESSTWTELSTRFERADAQHGILTASVPDLAAGVYVVRADVTDAAGNVGEARLQVSGDPAELRRQLAAGKEGVAGGGSGSKGGGAGGARGGRGSGGKGSRGSRPTKLVVHIAGDVAGDPRAAESARRASPGSGPTVSFASHPVLRGRLTTGGKGASWRRIKVVVRPDRGSVDAPAAAHATTGRDGRFRLRLPPGGSSGRLEASFVGGGGLAAAAAPPLRLRVRAAIMMTAEPTALRTGEAVTISGRVRPGAGRIPARGKLVAIQYFERDAGRWRPALLDRTDGDGHFELHYRFRYVTGEARIRLRATAVPEPGWPYAEGSSPPVTIEVRGR